MAERFKAVDCKSIEFLIVGSNPTFSLIKLTTFIKTNFNTSKYGAVGSAPVWEQEVMCSSHIISKYFSY